MTRAAGLALSLYTAQVLAGSATWRCLVARHTPRTLLLTFAALVLSTVLPTVAGAGVDVVLSSTHYVRVKGEPRPVVHTFPGLAGEATITVTNPGGGCTSAVVKVNGAVVFGPRSFRKKVMELTSSIAVHDTNALSVEVRSKPGSRLLVSITQSIDAAGAAVVGAAGGKLSVGSGPFAGAEIRIPPAALTAPVVLWAGSAADPLEADNEDPVLELQPHGLQFAVPVTVVLPAEAPSAGSIQHAERGGSAWMSLEQAQCEAGSLCAELTSFSFLRTFYARLCRWGSGKWRCDNVWSLFKKPWGTRTSVYWPVLLVHGLQPLSNPFRGEHSCGQAGTGAWALFPNQLDEAGLDIWRFDYDHERGIGVAADELSGAVEALQDWTDVGHTTLVAHSMGGLVARHFIAFGGGESRTSRLITIGTPHLGSEWGLLAQSLPGCKRAGEDMVRGSQFLDILNGRSPKQLLGPTPQYAFIAGLDRKATDCETYESDGIVSVNSALALDANADPRIDLYPGLVTRITLPGYPHTGFLFADSREECGDHGMIEPTDKGHRVYQEVLSRVRLPGAAGPAVIVFQSDRSQAPGALSIFRVNVDGTGLQDLTPGWPASPTVEAAPSVSPDGQRLAFVAQGEGLHVMSLDGANRQRVRIDATFHYTEWTADGTEILYNNPGTCSEDTYATPLDGSTRRLVVDAGVDFPQAAVYWVSRSMNDELAVVGTHCSGNAAVYLMSMNRSNVRLLYSNVNAVDWAPDGERLAIQVGAGSDFRIWIINRDGTGLRPLTPENSVSVHPAWSPDGSQIAYTQIEGASAHVFVMNSDGTGIPRQVTFGDGVNDWNPVWGSAPNDAAP